MRSRLFKSIYSFVLLTVLVAAPVLALDRINWWYGMNPPSSWFGMQERDLRLGAGQWQYNAFGSANGYFSNLCVTPGSGLNVTAGPCSTNSLASLYQYLADDTSSFGGPGGTALAADPTQIDLQALMTNAQASTIGPLNAPGTSGQSIIYAIECKVVTVDTTSQSQNFVSTLGQVTSSTVNRDRADQIYCQSKAGTASASPVAPTVDTGYVGVANVTVAYGAASLTSGNIAAITANGFYGFARVASLGLNASLPVCTDANAKVTTSGCPVPVTQTNTQAAGLPPTYNSSGTLISTSTLHQVLTSTTWVLAGPCAQNTQCSVDSGGSISFSGSAAFTSASTYTCTGTQNSNISSGVSPVFAADSGSSVTVYPYNATNGTVTGNVTIEIHCIGT